MTTLETRTITSILEVRSEEGQAPVVEGYAATFDEPYDMGPFLEVIDKRAFNRTLGTNPDVRLLVDHEGQPLARTKSGTLELGTDDHGLHIRAELDPSDPDVQRLVPKMRRKDLDQMSFAFRVAPGGDSWDYDNPQGTLRKMTELSLAGGDVSVVTYPANPGTAASIRGRREARCVFVERMSQELRSGRELPHRELVKLRHAIATIELETRMTAGDTAASLGEAVDDAHGGDRRYTWVEDWDEQFVYFTVYDWSIGDEDMFRQGYTLAADGMATLSGDAEHVRRRTSYVVVNQPDDQDDDVVETAAERAAGIDLETARRLAEFARSRAA